MSDLIKREDAIRAVEECLKLARPRYTVKTAIEAIPSIDVDISEYSDKLWRNAYERGKADRPQGEWIDWLGKGNEWECSVCRCSIESHGSIAYKFCPVCGARMKGADDDRGANQSRAQKDSCSDRAM